MRENSSIQSSCTGLATIALCLFPSHPDLVPTAPFQHRNQTRRRVSPYLPGSRRGRPRGRGWKQSAGTWWNLRGIFSSVLPSVLLCCFYFSPLSLPSPFCSFTANTPTISLTPPVVCCFHSRSISPHCCEKHNSLQLTRWDVRALVQFRAHCPCLLENLQLQSSQ